MYSYQGDVPGSWVDVFDPVLCHYGLEEVFTNCKHHTSNRNTMCKKIKQVIEGHRGIFHGGLASYERMCDPILLQGHVKYVGMKC